MIENVNVFQVDEKWSRRCPQCHKILQYNGKRARVNCYFHAKLNHPCKSCAQKARVRGPYNKKPASIVSVPVPDISINNPDTVVPEVIAVIHAPQPSKPNLIMRKAKCSNFIAKCSKCCHANMRPILTSDWQYSFVCSSCGASVTFTFLLEGEEQYEEAKPIVNDDSDLGDNEEESGEEDNRDVGELLSTA